MNEKNIKDKITKKINRENVKAFLKKQGLYVLIFLCVAAAGIIAIIAWPRDDGSQPPQVGENDPASVIGDTSLEDELAMQTPKPSPAPTATAMPTPSATPEETEKEKPNKSGGGSIKLKAGGRQDHQQFFRRRIGVLPVSQYLGHPQRYGYPGG